MAKPIILPDENRPPVELSKKGALERAIDNRQYRILMLNTQAMLGILNSNKTIYTQIKDVPKDTKVMGVNYDLQRDVFLMRLVSTEFSAIEAGTVIPFIEGEIEVKECTCKK